LCLQNVRGMTHLFIQNDRYRTHLPIQNVRGMAHSSIQNDRDRTHLFIRNVQHTPITQAEHKQGSISIDVYICIDIDIDR